MLSDIHFDPFHDPAKFRQLLTAPAADWPTILAAPPSPTQAADLAALQGPCHVRGVDTDWTLLDSSLRAAHLRQPSPVFVTVSGDLMAHAFDCRFHALAPKSSTDADYSAFAAKTVAFVAQQLHKSFPNAPIYLALGNNDSGCVDYSETPNSAFLHDDAKTFAANVISPSNRADILAQFSALGDYNVLLPAPLTHTRLIVLQDIFESKKYTGCDDKPNPDAATQQIAWLRQQLTAARDHQEHVWVMAHIPPGVDPYSTLTHNRKLCENRKPEMFLGSEDLSNVLVDFSDTIRLAIFAHTHMDELRLLQSSTPGRSVPAKLVSSISPVDGNNPTFTVAQLEPRTASLKDYEVYKATNKTGVDATWPEEYRFSSTYHLPDFSAASLTRLTDGFLADKSGSSPTSVSYQTFYFPGDAGLSDTLKAAAMHVVWPFYACSITQADAAAFADCACTNQPATTLTPNSGPKTP